jgi:outer membrane lipoprotein-sorting protein
MTNPVSRREALLTFVVGGLACAAAPALAAAPAPLTARDRADIARIEAYLNDVRTLAARFIQTASTGGFAEGRLYLERPGRLRLDYAPPSPLQVYANGFWLIYVDYELQNISQIPLSSTPAAVLVEKQVKLAGDVTVTRLERGAQTLRLHLMQTKEPDAGTLVLEFTDAPLRLVDWTVIDPQGVRTRVALVNPEFNTPIDRQLFFFDPPDWARAPQ